MERKPKNNKRCPLWGRVAGVVLWTLMAVILFVYGTVTCMVTVLSPDKLTPLVRNVANRVLDAEVSLGRVELSAKSTYPFLRLEVDSLLIVSPVMAAAKTDTTLRLPEYADTLLAVGHIMGELNMPRLLTGTVDVNNVAIVRPMVNIVIVNDSLNNFDIVRPGAESEDDAGLAVMPAIALRRFSIEDADNFRFYDAPTETHVTVGINTLIERNGEKPVYSLTFAGEVAGEMLQAYNMTSVPVSLDGDVCWDIASPNRVRLSEFSLAMAWLELMFDLDADFGEELTINQFDASCRRVKVSDLMAVVPERTAKELSLGLLRTDAELSVSVRLDSVFNLDRDSIPHATVALEVAPCQLRYGNARFERLAAGLTLDLNGNDLSKSVVTLDRLEVAGPATQLALSGRVTDVAGDPDFKVRVDGFTNLSKLPPPLLKMIEGYLSGKIKASVDVAGRMSMFDRNNFHRLKVDGDVDFSRLYWVSPDTSNMAFVDEACLKFGTKMKFNTDAELLAATLTADSASLLSGGIEVDLSDFSIGFGVTNQALPADTTIVVPMGGALKFKALNVNSITDSAGARFRDVAGKVVMKRYNNMSRVPEFMFDLSIDRMAAGSRDARMLFSGSRLHFDAHKQPVSRAMQAMRKRVDSIAKSRPDLPADSVMALALAKRRSHRSTHHRVHAELTDSSTEIIEWGTSKALGRLLLQWSLNGSLTSERAGLFTPHFPLRNRLDNLNITFNNDSILLTQLAYKVGRSDFLADGRIINVKGALTARRRLSPLKIELDAVCDTVDVNQLAEGFFRGASYSANGGGGMAAGLSVVDDESMFEREMDGKHDAESDTMAPVLIPANIEADFSLRAKNILYSDLLLHDMTGNVLVYDGALNLHQLQASSDVGSVDLSALYSAPSVDDIRFGFGLKVNEFDIARFMDLVPAIDSIMPLLRDVSGIINADIAATVDIDSTMNLKLPTLTAAVKLQGDSLQLLDGETFRTIAKWLMFKNKQRNIIDRMTVEMIISDGQMQMFPFIFDIDRYKLGVQGHNDLALNFNYLVSVLKSPLPFKFGITLKGNPDDYKIRLGKARFDEKQAVERKLIVDTARVNLIDQIENVFRRGVRRSEFAKLNLPTDRSAAADINLDNEPVTAADSLIFIREGLIPAPVDTLQNSEPISNKKQK